MKIALIGNPNSGKTTLFNVLTGKNEKTGNWAGVTTVKAAGKYTLDKTVEIVDLPGIYSFSAESKDEKEVEEYLRQNRPDVIINVIDSTNLERNLYLTYLISKMGIPFLAALNFSDEAERLGIETDLSKLSKAFGAQFIKISAKKKINTDKLVTVAKSIKNIVPQSVKSESKNAKDIYAYISKIAESAVKRNKTESKKRRFSNVADEFLTGKYTGIPALFVIIFVVYFLSLKIGGLFGGYIEAFFYAAEKNVGNFLASCGVSDALNSLFSTAVIKGLGSVISFLPQILVLFVLLTALEESGYMARVSFNLDKLFIKFGLGGKSVIPFVLSCGCAVTGIAATRTISDENERRNAVYLCPFMPCGAKTAVFGWFSYKFFGGSALVSVLMYFTGIAAAAVCGAIMSAKEKNKCNFVLEMPPLRRPSPYVIYRVVKDKTKDFLIKSGTVIFAVSVSFWLLSHFGPHGYVPDAENSFLFYIGNVIKYAFYPLGFSDWKASVALFSGFFAKEAVIETAELLSVDFLSVLPTEFKLFSYMIFILLSPPCGAALSAARRELGSTKDFLVMLAVQMITAFGFSSAINFAGIILANKNLIFSFALIIIIIVVFALFFRFNKKSNACAKCKSQCKNKRNQNTTI